ncbi:MAG: glycosyltransferase [Candidatus Paceibacterota bacterium]|jgi:GT2 family glycosyltransferase
MISIIIPVRFRADLTQVCIDSILLYTKNFELIVVQEGEDEEVRNLLLETYYPRFDSMFVDYEKFRTERQKRKEVKESEKSRGGEFVMGSYPYDNDSEPRLKYVQNKVPKGYAGALNAGLSIATGDYYCFMNNDTVVTPGWMDEMLKAFEDKDVGLVSPTFWGTGDRQSVDWNNGDQFDNVLDPTSIIGVCYLISKECMYKVGVWDESFGHGGEDFDMTIRVQNADYKLVIARRAFIYHYGGASTRIVIGNDLDKVRKNQMEKIMMVETKHGIDIRSKFIQK